MHACLYIYSEKCFVETTKYVVDIGSIKYFVELKGFFINILLFNKKIKCLCNKIYC